ncbi:AlpA family phage regulatory protein [Sphingomonas sp. ABOLE]|nr:AlpA family phage regulatory protein [Sphingomonas sp. ABOLE]
MEQLLRMRDVLNLVRLSRSTIYHYISEGDFPKQIRVGRRAVAFRKSDIERWIEERCHSSCDEEQRK